jgi:hypothetical protein
MLSIDLPRGALLFAPPAPPTPVYMLYIWCICVLSSPTYVSSVHLYVCPQYHYMCPQFPYMCVLSSRTCVLSSPIYVSSVPLHMCICVLSRLASPAPSTPVDVFSVPLYMCAQYRNMCPQYHYIRVLAAPRLSRFSDTTPVSARRVVGAAVEPRRP